MGVNLSAFLAQLRVDLDSGDGVVLMTNATSGLGTAGTDLLELLREREPLAPTPWATRSEQSDLLDLTGPWFWGTVAFAASLSADDLVLGGPGLGRGSRFRRGDDVAAVARDFVAAEGLNSGGGCDDASCVTDGAET